MSVAMSRSDGVTVLTLTSDHSSPCPPLCQLLGALCYSPALCSVRRRLTFQRGGALSALGALWIITGVMHIGLGTILINTRDTQLLSIVRHKHGPVWLGVLFMFFGVSCILAEKYPRPAVVLLSAVLNLAGIGLSISAIVWYSYGTADFWYYCRQSYEDNHWGTANPMSDNPWPLNYEQFMGLHERCVEAKDLMRALSTSVRATLVTLCILDFCLGVSSVILSFMALFQGFRESRDKPLLKENNGTSE